MFDSDVRAHGNNPRFQLRDEILTHQADLRARMLQGATGTPRAGNPTVHPAAPIRNLSPPTAGASPDS